MKRNEVKDSTAREAYDHFSVALLVLEKAQRNVEEVLNYYCEDAAECESWRHLTEAVGQFTADRDAVVGLLESLAEAYGDDSVAQASS